jgi:hypothetical protein
MNIFANAALRQRLLAGAALLGAAPFVLAAATPASADQQFLTRGSLVISSTTLRQNSGAYRHAQGWRDAAQHEGEDRRGSRRQ